jgi:hypothetical protein
MAMYPIATMPPQKAAKIRQKSTSVHRRRSFNCARVGKIVLGRRFFSAF